MPVTVSEMEIDLLRISAKELCEVLLKNPQISTVQQSAYRFYTGDDNPEFEVQVTVTRNENNFIRPLETIYS